MVTIFFEMGSYYFALSGPDLLPFSSEYWNYEHYTIMC